MWGTLKVGGDTSSGARKDNIISERLHRTYHEPGAAPSALCVWGKSSIIGGPLRKREMMMAPTPQGM